MEEYFGGGGSNPDYSGRLCCDSGCPSNEEYRLVGVCHQGDYHINISHDDTISNREVDTNLDGILSDEEFRASLRKGAREAWMISLDTNNDGLVSKGELVARMTRGHRDTGRYGSYEREMEYYRTAWRKWEESRQRIDKTGDDMLSLEEIWITRGRKVC